jgi:hypothetical protein
VPPCELSPTAGPDTGNLRPPGTLGGRSNVSGMTHPFLLPLPPLRPLPHDGECYELTEPLRWGEPDGSIGEVEAGYVTDLASVPALLRTLAPASGLHTPAAIRHDRRCDDLNEWHRHGRPRRLTPHLDSRATDREFRAGIRQLDPGRPLRAWVMWAGVRLGALGNPARSDGVSRDLPLLAVVLMLIAPLYLPVALVNGAALLVDRALNRVACLLCRPLPASQPEPAPAPLRVAA